MDLPGNRRNGTFGIFFMRWNVVIGGQIFSKSYHGFTEFKLQLIGAEGVIAAALWMVVPILILTFLLWLFPPWKTSEENTPAG